MKFLKFIPCALLALLAACGPPQPQYSTTIELIAPASEMGRMCGNNCLLSQQNCKQSCAMQHQSCLQTRALQERNDRLEARDDYEDYVRERTAQGKLIKRNQSSFLYHDAIDCDNSQCEAQCNQSFNICYGNCGGRVIPHTTCVANCTPMPQPGMAY